MRKSDHNGCNDSDGGGGGDGGDVLQRTPTGLTYPEFLHSSKTIIVFIAPFILSMEVFVVMLAVMVMSMCMLYVIKPPTTCLNRGARL